MTQYVEQSSDPAMTEGTEQEDEGMETTPAVVEMDLRAAEGSREHPESTQADGGSSIQGLNKVITPPQTGHDPRTHSPTTSGRGTEEHKRNKSLNATAPAEPVSWDHPTAGGSVVPEGAKRIMRGETGQAFKNGQEQHRGTAPRPEGMLPTRTDEERRKESECTWSGREGQGRRDTRVR